MDHAATVRTIYELISAHDLGGFGGHIAEDFVENEDLPVGPPTKEGVAEFFGTLFSGFSDLAAVPEEILDAGDKMVARVRFTGTNDGEFMGMPASGKPIDVNAIDIFRFEDDGLLHEHWGVFDAMAMMQQLGAIPGPG